MLFQGISNYFSSSIVSILRVLEASLKALYEHQKKTAQVRAMGNKLSKRRNRRVAKLQLVWVCVYPSPWLELEIMLESPTTYFRFDERQKWRTVHALAEATHKGASMVRFPGDDRPQTVFNNQHSRARMLGKIETFCRERATTSRQILKGYSRVSIGFGLCGKSE